MLAGSPYTSCYTPEGSKGGAPMATMREALVTMKSSISYYICGKTLNHFSGIGRRSGETHENGQYATMREDRRCLQETLQTALDLRRQMKGIEASSNVHVGAPAGVGGLPQNMRGLLNLQSGTSIAHLLIGEFFFHFFPLIKLILYSHGNHQVSNPGKNLDPRRGVSCVVGAPGRSPIKRIR